MLFLLCRIQDCRYDNLNGNASNISAFLRNGCKEISRFNQVRMRLLAHPDSDLLDCMVDAGYYDYSHFSKDFNQCLGSTPQQFKAWVSRMIARAGSENVEFLQDKP